MNLIDTVVLSSESVKYGYPHHSKVPHAAARGSQDSGARRLAPAAGLAAVEAVARGDHAHAGGEDEEVVAQRGAPDVGEVELDPLVPGERRAAVDLGPARDAGERVEPVALALRVAVDLHLDGR